MPRRSRTIAASPSACRGEQGEEGLQRQLPLDFLLPQLSRPKGPAGFVMSSQASSAGHGEAEVRRKTGRDRRRGCDDLHPLQLLLYPHRAVRLWHLDKGKPAERRDQVLMLDARNIYRKVTRKIYDFSRSSSPTSPPSSGSIADSRSVSLGWCRAIWTARLWRLPPLASPPPNSARPTRPLPRPFCSFRTRSSIPRN